MIGLYYRARRVVYNTYHVADLTDHASAPRSHETVVCFRGIRPFSGYHPAIKPREPDVNPHPRPGYVLSFGIFRDITNFSDSLRRYVLLNYIVNYWHMHDNSMCEPPKFMNPL